MLDHAKSVMGRPPKFDEDEVIEDDPDVIQLGYPFDLALDLWMAWDKKGVMPCSGGYLDQPRQWRRMIHLFNERYGLAFNQARADQSDPNEDGFGSARRGKTRIPWNAGDLIG